MAVRDALNPRESRIAENLSLFAGRALPTVAAVAPKPGLVDRNGNGSHKDMDFMTFVDSTLSLRQAFRNCAEEGLARGRHDPDWVDA